MLHRSTENRGGVTNVWQGLERVRGLNAVGSVWQRHLREQFVPFKRAFLIAKAQPAKFFPCERCGCAHEVHSPMSGFSLSSSSGGEGRGEEANFIHAVCSCEPWNCPDLLLSPDDL